MSVPRRLFNALALPRCILLVLLLLAGVLLVVACGGGDDDDDGSGSEPTATTTDNGDDGGEVTQTPPGDDGDGIAACALLTASEVEAVVGLPITDTVAESTHPFNACTWSTDSFDSVTVAVLAGIDADLEAFYELTEDAEDVDGLGKRAQWSEFGDLEILTDDYDVLITMLSTDLEEGDARDAAISLAGPLLDRLP